MKIAFCHSQFIFLTLLISSYTYMFSFLNTYSIYSDPSPLTFDHESAKNTEVLLSKQNTVCHHITMN
jgi:hypothetical protein